jgi:hypothetical protein
MRSLFLFFLLIPLFVFSQINDITNISGKITDEAGNVLPDVHIFIQNESDGKIYGFAFSNEEGNYFISMPKEKENKILIIKLLGFQDQVYPLSDLKNPFDIRLIISEKLLDEITITPKGIRQYGDTTEYLLSAFADGMEVKVEDLLKKLPGIRIDEDGSITFRGKSIQKINLDGTDLFDHNYKIASKNIPAGYISSVQAIEHYHENKLLKDAEHSDEVILNLNFREDISTWKPFGDTQAGGGYKNKYQLDNQLFSFTKKIKLYDILTINNNELSPTFSVMDNRRNFYKYFGEYADAAVKSSFIPDNSSIEGEIERSETKREYSSMHLVYQPDEKLQITGNLLLNQLQSHYSDENRILYLPDSLLVEESSHIRNKVQTVYGMLKLNYDIRDKVLLEYQTKWNWDGQLVHNRMKLADNYLDYIREKTSFRINEIHLTLAMEDSSAWVIGLSNAYNKNSQLFDYKKVKEEIKIIDQFMNASNTQSNVSAAYYNKNDSRFFYTLAGLFSYNQQNLKNQITQFQTVFTDEASLKDISMFLDINLTYQFGKSIFSFNPKLGYHHQNIQRPLGNFPQHTKAQWEFAPRLSYEIKWKEHSFSIFGTYAPNRYYLNNYIDYFSSYRDRIEASSQYEYGSSISYGGTYINFSFRNNNYIFLSYINTINYNTFSPKIVITPDMNYYKQEAGSQTKTQFILLNLKKYIDPIRHNFQLDNSFFYYQYRNSVNSESMQKVQNYSNNLRFSIRSILNIPFEYIIGMNIYYSLYQTNTMDGNKNWTDSFFQSFLYKPNRKIRFKLRFDEHFTGKDNHFYLFIRPDITYVLKLPDRITIGFSAYNLFDYRSIRNYDFQDYFQREQEYSIRPAQYAAYVRFKW